MSKRTNAISADAIIIGGGHNGLVCAYYLAQQNFNVVVLERSSVLGGAAITEEFHPGFRNSVASYTVSLLQSKIIDDMRLHDHGLEVVLRKVDNFIPDESDYFLAGRNGLTRSEIARISPEDAERFDEYEAALNEVVDCLREFLWICPPNAGGGLQDVLSLLQSANVARRLSEQAQRDLFAFFTKSASEILDHYFIDERVKALFGFDAIVGNYASPKAPGSAYVLLHHVFGEAGGVPQAWGHAIGGMGAITQAMKSACEQAGVTLLTERSVDRVMTERGQVIGVKATSAAGENEIYRAPLVASSVHPKILFERLVAPTDLDQDFRARIAQFQSQSGTFRMNVALSELPAFSVAPTQAPYDKDYLTGGIIIAPTLHYMDRAWRDAEDYGWSKAPIIEMLVPSTLDKTLAPEGQHVASLFCQQFRFKLPDGQHWDDVKEIVADSIIAAVDERAPGFKRSVLGRQILSPQDLQDRLGLVGGDIFHGRMSLDQLFSARPVLGSAAYRAPIRNLYLCGSGSHPGGGVTGIPGHNAAREIIRDHRGWRRVLRPLAASRWRG